MPADLHFAARPQVIGVMDHPGSKPQAAPLDVRQKLDPLILFAPLHAFAPLMADLALSRHPTAPKK